MKLLRLKFTLFKKYKKVYFLSELLDNACGCMYFINHKTKDYFTEDAGLLDLSVSTLKELKSHDSKLLSGDNITVEKIIIGNTQPAHNFPRTSPEGFLKVVTPWTYKRLGDFQRNNTKIDDFVKKNCYSEVIVLLLHICFCFLSEEQIFKSFKWGRPRTSTRPSCGKSMGPNDGTF